MLRLKEQLATTYDQVCGAHASPFPCPGSALRFHTAACVVVHSRRQRVCTRARAAACASRVAHARLSCGRCAPVPAPGALRVIPPPHIVCKSVAVPRARAFAPCVRRAL